MRILATLRTTALTLAAALIVCTTASAQYENNTIKIGSKAPELAYKTPKGEVLKLSSVNKGRYVLVDFWASWCGPCRRANPGLVAMYNKYKDNKTKSAKKGFTIYSVSLDKTKEDWTKAVTSDGLIWENHVSDLGHWRSAAAKTYGVEYIPQAFLLDPSGKVVGKYMTAEEAAPDLLKIFGK